MDPSTTSITDYVQAVLPPRAQVRWRTLPGGTAYSEEVSIPEGVPRNFQGTLVFEIQKGGRVEVRVEDEG